MPITTLTDKAVLQWIDSAKEWKATTVLAGIASSTIIAGGTQGQALTSKGSTAPKFEGMTTQGDVEYYSGTARTRLAPGTSGQFLKTLGAAANPAWATVGGVSAIKLDWANSNLAASQAETTVKSYTLVGGTLGTNDGLRITFYYTGGTTATLRFKWGGGTVFTDNGAGASPTKRAQVEIWNTNSASAQKIISFGISASSTPAFKAATGGDTSPSINTAADVAILITGETDVSGPIDVLGWTIEHIRA